MSSYWWLSFVDHIDDVVLWLGSAIVPGDDMDEAVDYAWRCGANPGGTVTGTRLAADSLPASLLCRLLDETDSVEAQVCLTVRESV